jgi:hypothetical protein
METCSEMFLLLPADREGEAFLQLFTPNKLKTGTGPTIKQHETIIVSTSCPDSIDGDDQ